MPWHSQPIEEIFTSLHSTKTGLSASDASRLQQEHGKNELVEKGRRSKLLILVSQFKDLMILILVIAAIISFMAGDAIDGFVIIAIILGNAWMGYVQENKAEESMAMLKKMDAQNKDVSNPLWKGLEKFKNLGDN